MFSWNWWLLDGGCHRLSAPGPTLSSESSDYTSLQVAALKITTCRWLLAYTNKYNCTRTALTCMSKDMVLRNMVLRDMVLRNMLVYPQRREQSLLSSCSYKQKKRRTHVFALFILMPRCKWRTQLLNLHTRNSFPIFMVVMTSMKHTENAYWKSCGEAQSIWQKYCRDAVGGEGTSERE